jgi:hypothetical protein
MEPRVIYNQYTVGEHGTYVDISTHQMVEGEILSVIDDRTGLSEAVYLMIRVDRGIRTIRVA